MNNLCDGALDDISKSACKLKAAEYLWVVETLGEDAYKNGQVEGCACCGA
jgi:hypothetical protein